MKSLKTIIKKVGSITLAAGLIGSTFIGATFATGLQDLPHPFIKNGQFDSYIIVGETAKTIDVAGAIEIATTLGQLSTNKTTSQATQKTAEININSFKGPETTAELDTIGGGLSIGKGTSNDIMANYTYVFNSKEYTATQTTDLYETNISKTGVITIPAEKLKHTFEIYYNNGQVNMTANPGLTLYLLGQTFSYSDWDTTNKNITIATAESKTKLQVGDTFTVAGNSIKILEAYSNENIVDLSINNQTNMDISSYEKDGLTINNIHVKKSTSGETYISMDISVSQKTMKIGDEYPYAGYIIKDITDNKLTIVNKNKITVGDEYTGPNKAVTLYNIETENTGNYEKLTIKETSQTSYVMSINKTDGTLSFANPVPGQKYENITEQNFDAVIQGNFNFTNKITDTQYLKITEPTGNRYIIKFSGKKVDQTTYKNQSGVFVVPKDKEWKVDGITTYINTTDSELDTITFTSPNLKLENNVTNKDYMIRYGEPTIFVDGQIFTGYTEYLAKLNYNTNENKLTITEGNNNIINIQLYKNETTGDITFKEISENNNTITTYGTKIKYYNATDNEQIPATQSQGIITLEIPEKQVKYGLGSYTYETKTLEQNKETKIGNSTVTLKNTTETSQNEQINRIDPGFAMLDTQASRDKPIILVGGPAVNTLAKELVDSQLLDYADLLTMGEGHAQVDLIENAFGTNTALVIAGYTGEDTLLATRTVSASLNKKGLTLGNSTRMLLNTGVSVYTAVTEIQPTNATEQ